MMDADKILKVVVPTLDKKTRMLAMLDFGTTDKSKWFSKTAARGVSEWKDRISNFDWKELAGKGAQWLKDNQKPMAYGLGAGLAGGALGGLAFGRRGALLGFILSLLGGGAYGLAEQKGIVGGDTAKTGNNAYQDALKAYAEQNPRPDREAYRHWYMPRSMEINRYAEAVDKWMKDRRQYAGEQAGKTAVNAGDKTPTTKGPVK